MGRCQNDGPFSGTLNVRCRIIIGIRKGIIILTTTQTKLPKYGSIVKKAVSFLLYIDSCSLTATQFRA